MIGLEKTKEEYIRGLLDDLKDIRYVLPEDIPNIDLYMDQVTTFMDEHLCNNRRNSEDKLLTKTMINNYTKNELLPSPKKKKYSKEHMFLLIFIYYFKNILSINDIQSVFNPLTNKYFGEASKIELKDIYKEIFDLEKEQADSISKDIIRKLNKAKETFPELEGSEDHDFLTMFSFICMLSFDVYIKKQMIERIIDHSIKPVTEESSEKVAKPADKSQKTTEKVAKTADKTTKAKATSGKEEK